jgi:hypothetical protein
MFISNSTNNENRKSLLIEREDISWRRRYLREIKKIRQEGRPFILQDTWLLEMIVFEAGHVHVMKFLPLSCELTIIVDVTVIFFR